MAEMAALELDVVARKVPLQYRGAEGVVFQDAVVVVRNTGAVSAPSIGLLCTVANEDKLTVDRLVDLTPLGFADTLKPGAEGTVSFFRLLQREARGFGSKVSLFGYRAVLNWTYDLTATPVAGPDAVPAGTERRWQVRWQSGGGEHPPGLISQQGQPGLNGVCCPRLSAALRCDIVRRDPRARLAVTGRNGVSLWKLRIGRQPGWARGWTRRPVRC